MAAFVRLAVDLSRSVPQQEDAQSRAQTLAADAVAHQFDVAMQLREKQEQKSALFASLCARQRALACARKAEQYRFNAMREKETTRLMRENQKHTQNAEEKERNEKRQNKRKQERLKLTAWTLFFAGLCTVVVLLFTQFLLPYSDYKKAQSYQASGDLEAAYAVYERLGSFRDSEEQCKRIEDIISADVPTLPFPIARLK